MTISGLSVVANVFVLILHHKNVKIQKPMPKLVRKNFLFKILNYDPSLLKNFKRGKFFMGSQQKLFFPSLFVK
jgi:hypothetical protein